MSMLKPPESVVVGMTVVTLVYGVYQIALPSIVDERVADSDNPDLQAAEKLASWTAAAVVSGVSLLTKDATVFIMGGTALIVLSWMHRHADQVSPLSGKATGVVTGPFTQEDGLPVDNGGDMGLFAG
jgi:uncharacterized membrane protein